ncbi:hypothetical protein F5Y04DRAFT_279590 [Hypomontagnella monticulosa]|nr:hypothetical protein F5Y04DRAFT_279590 [Hypomontagnella monticulosa]
MYKLSVFVLAAISAGLARADPKCYTGPTNPAGNNIALWQCVNDETKAPKWHSWECQNKNFQYWSNGKWGSPADCLGGCTPCLEGAAVMGAEWVKCDQEVHQAHCAVGWSPKGKAFCGASFGPC